MTDEVYYRFFDRRGDFGPIVELDEYPVIRRTPAGAWVYIPWRNRKMWIGDNSARKYAWPTKEEAENSYRIRKTKQLQYLRETAQHVWLILGKPEWPCNDALKGFVGFEAEKLPGDYNEVLDEPEDVFEFSV